MGKYILETKSQSEWQKQLNQWKHNYDIKIINMIMTKPEYDDVTILLLRTEKRGL